LGADGGASEPHPAQVKKGRGGVDIYVVVPIEEVVLEGLPATGLQVDHDCILFPDKAEVLQFTDLPLCENRRAVREIIGEADRNTIINAGAVVFARQESQQDLDEPTARRFLLRVMTLAEQFLFMLWLVKDNSGNTGDGFIALGVQDRGITHLFTQRPGGLNFTANCDRVLTQFMAAEVETAARYFAKFSTVNPQIEWRLDAPRPSGLIHKPRIVRTMYFAQAARRNAELGLKLAFYCICFESLFASESDSISHRVAERAAILIGAPGEQRREIYRDIRQLYSARSKVVHGASFSPERIEGLRQLAQKCDEHLRKAIRLILDDAALLDLFSNRSSEAIDAYFLEQLFPGNPPTATSGTTI
jgi:hypothetical protein